ncbi:hypothetical protein GCM10010915_09690 [Microbacterium faecale]|uniref:Glycosyltransferase 2-like domain-containing protein n=1 Tax=Microbacterium faecale TaxID=1804630 RepID=A0A916Y507_9MICO|nr:glycosyltransferase [Microbacterium faecale]GGD31457.1 hypothetical protein GCM10010915_09690 [Microbacterium faecale]
MADNFQDAVYAEWVRRSATDGIEVSIVLPLYNAEGGTLGLRLEALTAVNDNQEVVIVDDGSTDGTLQQVLEATGHLRNVVILSSPRNGGVARARNAAVATARGAYVWFVDWDDEWTSEAARRMLEIARQSDADVVICNAHLREGDSATSVVDGLASRLSMTGPDALTRLLDGEIFGYLWSKLIRRALLGTDPFPSMQFQSDLGGLVPVLARAKVVEAIPDVLYTHVAREGSVSRSVSTDVTCKFECRDIVERTVATLEEGASGPTREKLQRWVYRRVYLGSVNTAVRLGQDRASMALVITRVKDAVRWRDLFRHLKNDPTTAVKLLAVKALGRHYGDLTRRVRNLKNSPRPLPAADDDGRTLRIMHVAPPRADTTSYVDLISDSGVEHTTFNWWRALRLEMDVLNVHWPERLIRGRTAVHRIGKRLAARVLFVRLRRSKVATVRTLHNIAPHESGPRGEQRLLAHIDRETDAFVALNRWTPVPGDADRTVIAHPHYRRELGERSSEPAVAGRILYFGLIRDYKGVDNLLDAFSRVDDASYALRIVGSPVPKWRAIIDDAVAESPRISCKLEYVSDDELALEIQRASLVVFPYRKMHNSGAALAALSLGRPVLVPNNEVNRDLAEEVGESWVQRFDDELNAHDIEQALKQAAPLLDSDAVPNLSRRSPGDVSKRYVEVYRHAITMKSMPPQ